MNAVSLVCFFCWVFVKKANFCYKGTSFLLPPRSHRELNGFRFGFHVSVSFDGGASWSEQVLVGKDAARTPLSLLRSGPPMLLCYSVVADPRLSFERRKEKRNPY